MTIQLAGRTLWMIISGVLRISRRYVLRPARRLHSHGKIMFSCRVSPTHLQSMEALCRQIQLLVDIWTV